jgi:hypothetical protein
MTRLHAKENNILKDNINYSNLDLSSRLDANGDYALQKKRHRKNSSVASRGDWTKKIYVLVTSGYLLQYAGEGSFDRLPERMLHLGKDSAAFASDLIPGCHWVLQVSAAMDQDGATASDSRSLLSRFPFRGPEKRRTSTVLMVFEGADDMDSWIACLRREIEALGGKKHLSETGKPKSEEDDMQLRAQASQRTLVVRDPNRFSQAISQDMSWEDGSLPDAQRISTDTTAQGTPDLSFDEMSMASGMSLEGRQLENLRDSAHRLSYISLGQRTFVTSDGSSLSGSPIRDSFASQTDDFPMPDAPLPEVQLRPNAMALAERRQSVLTSNAGMDFRLLPVHVARGPLGTAMAANSEQPAIMPPAIPNFSVPNSASRRYSLMKSPPTTDLSSGNTQTAPLLPRASLGSVRSQRRAPPTTLPLVRPLSIVADQPSPPVAEEPMRIPSPEISRDEVPAGEMPLSATESTQPPVEDRALSQESPHEGKARRLSAARPDQERAPPKLKLRRLSSMKSSLPILDDAKVDLPAKPIRLSATNPLITYPLEKATLPERPRSSMEVRSARRSRSPSRSQVSVRQRISLYSQQPSDRTLQISTIVVPGNFGIPGTTEQPAAPFTQELGKSLPTTPSVLPGAELLQPQRKSQKDPVNRRRSMPQMASQGPPPAPPPTRSLPPLPKKASTSAIPPMDTLRFAL